MSPSVSQPSSPLAPTTLIVPGADAPAPAPSGPGVPIAWILLGVVLTVGLWAGLNGRRRRRIDPCELAFQRVARRQGWSRSQVRALRKAAYALGLTTPIGLALSPTLTARVFNERPPRRG